MNPTRQADVEIFSGLHSCKPGNEPVAGEIKTFVIEQKTSQKNGKPYLKIKSAGADYGGEPYRILSAKPTGFIDARGNISFNLEIEPAVLGQDLGVTRSNIPLEGGGGERHINPVQAASSSPLPYDSRYDTPEKATRPYNALDERQRAIIRQHSQSMAVEVLKLKVTLNELTVEDLTPAKLRQLADYFDADVLGAAK